ncbi:MAG: lipopolysaccharide biosynthesis protein, partial [Porcipelethomonas sp.]
CSDAFSVIFLYTAGRLYKLNKFRYIDCAIIKEMLRYSLPLIPTYLLWWITSSSDRIFVIKMEGSEINGVYAAAYKLPTLLMFMTTMFYQAWQISSVEEKDSSDVGEFYSNVFNIYSSLIFVAAAFLILFAKPITNILLSGKTYSDAEKYTVILILSMVFQCFCQFLSSIYSIKKKSKKSCITALAAATCNIILNLILIPLFGVYGASAATAASYFVCFVIRSADTRKYIYFKLNKVRISINTSLLIIMSIVSINESNHIILILTWLFIVIVLVNIQNFLKETPRNLKREKI